MSVRRGSPWCLLQANLAQVRRITSPPRVRSPTVAHRLRCCSDTLSAPTSSHAARMRRWAVFGISVRIRPCSHRPRPAHSPLPPSSTPTMHRVALRNTVRAAVVAAAPRVCSFHPSANFSTLTVRRGVPGRHPRYSRIVSLVRNRKGWYVLSQYTPLRHVLSADATTSSCPPRLRASAQPRNDTRSCLRGVLHPRVPDSWHCRRRECRGDRACPE